MTILSNLFGSEFRVKIMRLFVFNPERNFDIEQVKIKTDARPREIQKELKIFLKIGLIKPVKKNGRTKGYTLDRRFKYLTALNDFLVKTHSLENKTIIKKLEKTGRIKAVLISGIFTGNADSRFDLFVVGDNVKSTAIDRIVKAIESDMGKDIRYALLSGPDFAYRKSMNDKLVRDVIDYPHTVLLDKIGLFD